MFLSRQTKSATCDAIIGSLAAQDYRKISACSQKQVSVGVVAS
jgi:hypothetical protein